MWNNSLIIDGVAHGYDWRPENRAAGLSMEAYLAYTGYIHKFLHEPLESLKPGFQMTLAELTSGWSAEELAEVFFEESDVDLIVYHEVFIAGAFDQGASPWHVGEELKRAYPERVLLYSFVDPLMGPEQLDLMEERAATGLVDGFKFYPANGVFDAQSGQPRTIFYDDPELAYPYFEKARSLGVNQIAVHKAFPVGPGRMDKDRVEDVSTAAVSFPDLTFEIVHGGWAFLEDTVLQLMMHPNIYVNLEAVVSGAVRRPRRFAEILGEMLIVGGEERILWATGSPATHPQPVVEAFAALEMPEDLMEGHGFPELTTEIKENIFGRNFARLHGIDVEARAAALAGDEWSERRREARAGGVEPWRAHRARMAAEVG